MRRLGLIVLLAATGGCLDGTLVGTDGRSSSAERTLLAGGDAAQADVATIGGDSDIRGDSGARADGRVGREGPAAKPDGPKAKPDGPRAKPDGPKAKPDVPKVEPDGPSGKRDAGQVDVAKLDTGKQQSDTSPPRIAGQPASGEGHAADTDCMSSGCHVPGGAGAAKLIVTACGTVHATSSGGGTVPGATVVITDSAGKVIKLVTGPYGVFSTTESLTSPLAIRASKCPDTAPMVSQASSGHCGSCHTGSQLIHLP